MTTALHTIPAKLAALWAHVADRVSARPVVGHVVQALLLFGIWVLAIRIGLQVGWYPIDVGYYVAIGGITAAAVAVCRVAPLRGLLVVGLLTVWPEWSFDVPELRIVPIVVAAFLATSSGARLRIAAPIAALIVLLVNIPSWVWSVQGPFPEALRNGIQNLNDPSTRILAAIVVCGALLLGFAVRVQRTNVETLRAGNAELVRLRDADIARVAAEERTTIARDIHDVVAHHVSAMVIRAQAADRVADTRPNELREAVRWIAEDGQEALAAMRQVVRVLRADTDASVLMTPVDFASAVDELVRRVRATGLEVHDDLAPGLELSAMQQAAIVRIVQEALTNVMLHSDASSVRVSLLERGQSIELRVDDDGSPAALPAVAAGGGSGIRGMRERAEAAGGTLVSGRLSGRGWTIMARLPMGAA